MTPSLLGQTGRRHPGDRPSSARPTAKALCSGGPHRLSAADPGQGRY